MLRLAGLSVLLIATVLLPVGTCRAQFSSDEGNYAQLLAKYDKNGDGLLDNRERAALLAPIEHLKPLAALSNPLICGGQSGGSAGGSTASAEQQSLLPRQMGPRQIGRRVRWRRQQFAEDQPQGDPQPNQVEGHLLTEELDGGYTPGAPPQPVEPQRQNVRFRNVVQYRMLLNESKAQPRSQPFARAATFGPIVGLSKQQPPGYNSANVDVCCSSSRVSFYGLAGY